MKSLMALKLASFITVLAVGFAGTAAAQSPGEARLSELAEAAGCEFPEMPNVPSADGATMEQMVETQGAVQAYIEESNELLQCLQGISANEELPVEDRQMAIDRYNAEIDAQEMLAERWNGERARFLEQQEQ